MERIGIRELRNHTSGPIRRAMAGERIIITIDGVPAAQLGPLNTGDPASVADLIAAGLLEPPRTTSPPPAPKPVRAPAGPSSTEILREHRSR